MVSAVGAFCVTVVVVVVVDIVTIYVGRMTIVLRLVSKKKEGGLKWRISRQIVS